MKTEEFKQILSDVKGIAGMNPEKAVDVALTLVQESGKDKRIEVMNEAKLNNNSNGFSRNYSNGNAPATERQKFALMKNGVSFSDNITKAEASVLLDKVMPKTGSDGKGSNPAPSFPK